MFILFCCLKVFLLSLLIKLFLVTIVVYQGSSSPVEMSEKNLIQNSSNVVSNNIYKILVEDKENVLFCPVSSNILLSLMTIATKGKTADELKNGLNLNSGDEEIKFGYKKLLNELHDGKLNVATRLYPKTGVTLKPEFLTVAQKYFESDVQAIDYSTPTNAAKIINTYVEEKTNNKIHDLVDPDALSADTSLVLVNAAHFKDNWRYPFDLFESDFHIGKTEKVKTTMMKNTNWFPFKSSMSLDAKVVRIPFENTKYSMVIVLPNEIDGLNKVETKLNSNFEEVLSDLLDKRVEVKIPKFKIEAKLDLQSVLEKIGVKTLFTNYADLSGLVADAQLFVSQVIQKTYIDVNENGVEAAAATELGIVGFSSFTSSESPEQFTADHPFLFAIMHDNLIIFQGRLSKV